MPLQQGWKLAKPLLRLFWSGNQLAFQELQTQILELWPACVLQEMVTNGDLDAVVRTMPQFAQLGPPFKSSEPAKLTEEETEYNIAVVVHVFARHLLLQFNCTNTVAEQVLENVSVTVDLGEAVRLPSKRRRPATHVCAVEQHVWLGRLGALTLTCRALLAPHGLHIGDVSSGQPSVAYLKIVEITLGAHEARRAGQRHAQSSLPPLCRVCRACV